MIFDKTTLDTRGMHTGVSVRLYIAGRLASGDPAIRSKSEGRLLTLKIRSARVSTMGLVRFLTNR